MKKQLVKFQLELGWVTSGGTITFGVKENNYLGKGLSVDSNLT